MLIQALRQIYDLFDGCAERIPRKADSSLTVGVGRRAIIWLLVMSA